MPDWIEPRLEARSPEGQMRPPCLSEVLFPDLRGRGDILVNGPIALALRADRPEVLTATAGIPLHGLTLEGHAAIIQGEAGEETIIAYRRVRIATPEQGLQSTGTVIVTDLASGKPIPWVAIRCTLGGSQHATTLVVGLPVPAHYPDGEAYWRPETEER